MRRLFPYISLFASFGTVVCCALPALLVSLGLGATVAAAVSNFPQLVWLSENKEIVFAGAGILIALSFVASMNAQHTPCPSDPVLGVLCATGRSFSKPVLILATIIYLIGGFFAFVAPLITATE